LRYHRDDKISGWFLCHKKVLSKKEERGLPRNTVFLVNKYGIFPFKKNWMIDGETFITGSIHIIKKAEGENAENLLLSRNKILHQELSIGGSNDER
jgi:hypothetical protein